MKLFDKPFLAKGFRPFFLSGSVYGVVLMGLWLGGLHGWWKMPTRGMEWHAHEMLFGFMAAIVAGFLLTASANWTGTRGIHGRDLALVWGLWLLGRLVFLLQWWWNFPVLSWLNLPFTLAFVAALWPVLFKKEQKRNIPILFWLSLLALAHIAFLLDWTYLVPGWGRRGLYVGMGVEVFLLVLIGGRILPFFTGNIFKDKPIRKWHLMDQLTLAAAAAFVFSLLLFGEIHKVTGGIAGVTALFALLRARAWYGWLTFRVPILHVLHLAWLWLVIAFVLTAWVVFGDIPLRAATHAFTVGALSFFALSMMTRVSLGHTGRKIQSSLWSNLGFVLMFLSAGIRVGGALGASALYHRTLTWSGLLWMGAFFLYAVEFAPVLCSARPDGREG